MTTQEALKLAREHERLVERIATLQRAADVLTTMPPANGDMAHGDAGSVYLQVLDCAVPMTAVDAWPWLDAALTQARARSAVIAEVFGGLPIVKGTA